MFHEHGDEVRARGRRSKEKMKKMDRLELAARIREVRSDLYGEHGAPLLADDLGIPAHNLDAL